MANIQQKHKSREVCIICGKADTVSMNRPNSQHKTKRTVKPNFQTKFGVRFCQNCFRTLKKKGFEFSLPQKAN